VARLIALVGLRLRIDLRVLLGARERLLGLVLMIPGLLIVSALSCFVALFGVRALEASQPAAVVPALSAAATLIGGLWCLSPLLTGFALTESHDMARLLHFPISLPTLVVSSLIANLAQPAVLTELPMLACLALAVAGLSARLPLALIGVGLSFATILALAQLTGLVLHGLARNRRFHDIALSAGVLIGFAVSLLPLLLFTHGVGVLAGLLRFVVATDVFALSPFAWGVRAAVYAGRGHAGGCALFSLLGSAAIVAAMGASAGLIQRVYRGDVVLSSGRTSAGQSRMLFRGPVGALVEKDLRSAWRDPALKSLLLIGFTGPLFFLFVISQTRLDSGSGHALLWLATIIGISGFGANALGLERRGIGLLLGFPVARAKVLLAKNLSAILLRLPSLVMLLVATLVLATPSLVPAVLTVTAVTMLQAAGVDNYLSIFFPFAAPAPGSNPYRGAAGGRGFGASMFSVCLLGVALVCAAPFAFLAWLPLLLERPWLWFVSLPLALGGAGAVYAMLLAGAARLFARREPELLERILGEV
jgi:ABC-2 type transport system permease protein